jgi:type II secretory pathway pseudopilin PulG
MLKHRGGICRRVLLRSSVGFTLVEVVVAIALLALVVGGVLTTMTVVFNMQTRNDQQRTAEFLTRSEFEYIKSQPYSWGNISGNYRPLYEKVQNTLNYSLDVVAIPIDNSTYKDLQPPIDPVTGSPVYPAYVDDKGIQKIIISVYSGKQTENLAPVLVTTNYKVARWEGQ